MAILDDLLSLLPSSVWNPSPGSNVYNLMASIANELSRFNDLSGFVHEQVNITSSSGEFLDIHGLDFGVTRANNPFTSQPESDSAYQQAILSVFQAVRLNKYVLQNLLVPYSNNPPVIFEDMIDRWFIGGSPLTDLQPFSFIGFDTIGESENLINSIKNLSSTSTTINFNVVNAAVTGAPNDPIQYNLFLQLPFQINVANPSQISIPANGLNLQGAFQPGRQLRFTTNDSINPQTFYTSVSTFEFEHGDDNVVFLTDAVAPVSGCLFVAPMGDTAFVNYQDPVSQYVYSWTAEVDQYGNVELDNSKRSDTVPPEFITSGYLPLGNLDDYSLINTGLLSVRGVLDPMYTIDIILTTISPKLGDSGNLGQGLVLGQVEYPPQNRVLPVLTYNKLGGIVPRIFIVEPYVGDYRNNSNNLQDLYG